jgi:hypothetical protein
VIFGIGTSIVPLKYKEVKMKKSMLYYAFVTAIQFMILIAIVLISFAANF